MPKSLFSLVLLGFTTFVFAQKSQQENLELRKAKIQKEIIDNEKKLLTVKKKDLPVEGTKLVILEPLR